MYYKNFLLFFFLLIHSLIFSQGYLDRTKSAMINFYCMNPDSMVNELDKIRYDKRLVFKDEIIFSNLDSVFFLLNKPLNYKELKDLLGSTGKIKEEDYSKTLIVYGGYLKFFMNIDTIGGKKYLYLNIYPKKDLSSANLHFRKKYKMLVRCKIVNSKNEVNYFFNFLYFYKYLYGSSQFNSVKNSDFHVYLLKEL